MLSGLTGRVAVRLLQTKEPELLDAPEVGKLGSGPAAKCRVRPPQLCWIEARRAQAHCSSDRRGGAINQTWTDSEGRSQAFRVGSPAPSHPGRNRTGPWPRPVAAARSAATTASRAPGPATRMCQTRGHLHAPPPPFPPPGLRGGHGRSRHVHGGNRPNLAIPEFVAEVSLLIPTYTELC